MNKQDTLFIVERLDQKNVNDLPVLYHAVYGGKVRAELFLKKYQTGSVGIEYLGFIVYTNEHTPAAFLGAVPCELYYDEKLVLAAQLTDGMTDPAYKNKALFTQLIERITELCEQHGVLFLFGFPNQHSLPVFLGKAGWDVYGKMDLFSLPVQSVPLEKISRKFPFLEGIYRRYQYFILRKYIHSPAGNLSSPDPGVHKNENYYKHRYSGTYLLSIQQALIRIKISNGLAIGEISVTENEFVNVMHELTAIARKLGLDKIIFHCSTGSELHRLFTGRYPSTPSFTIICKDPGSGMPLDKIKFTYADIDIF